MWNNPTERFGFPAGTRQSWTCGRARHGRTSLVGIVIKNSITGKDNDKYKLDENSEKGNFWGRNWAPPTKSSRTIERQKHQDYSLIMLAGRVSCLPFLIDLTWTARRRSFVLRQTGRQIHGQSMPCRQRARPKTKQFTTGNIIDCRLKYTSLKVASLFNIEIIIPR